DPAARASTVKSTVSFGGSTCVSFASPLGNPTFALSTLTRTRTGNGFLLMIVTGTLPDFAVSVTRRPDPTWIPERMPSNVERTRRASRSPNVGSLFHSDDSAARRFRSYSSPFGSGCQRRGADVASAERSARDPAED